MKLTKQDIEKVRHIEGFPIAKDEDIIALSRPPYYTACPNPFIEDYIREHGTPYDEATDDYHREPFAADVSEGKNDPIYMAHSYHTKVPHKAIMRYILHYTKPGDIVFDGFCGTGMTGVAAQMCGNPDSAFKTKVETENQVADIEWGARKAILNDLSPVASFISYNYNAPLDKDVIRKEIRDIVKACRKQYSWMYETLHVDEDGSLIHDISGNPIIGQVNYTLWSDILICPSCSKELVYWDVGVDKDDERVLDSFNCLYCHSSITKRECSRAAETIYDDVINRSITIAKQVPVRIFYFVGKTRYSKKPQESDFKLMKTILDVPLPSDIPIAELPDGSNTAQPKQSHGVNYVHQFFTRRNLVVFAYAFSLSKSIQSKFALTSIMKILTKMYRWVPGGKSTAGMPGTLFLPSISHEYALFDVLDRRVKKLSEWFDMERVENATHISCGDLATCLIPSNSVDYIFTDPPFGANLNYSELSFLWESWLSVVTNNKSEAIINDVQRKSLFEYQEIMEDCFIKYYDVLKPKRWMTIEFHNSQNAVWNSIQEALQRSGFIIADVRTLDKKQGSFKQVTTTTAVKQDLVISAYKPKDSFVRDFQQHAGDLEMVWKFVHQHLETVPVTADGNKDGVLDLITERCDYLLFDRMVAYHIMHGISVPLDAHTFYEGLRQRFLERDGMFFLPDQVTAYDEKRLRMKLDTTQFSFVVTDEKNAIQWLNYILKDKSQTYQDIQPQYLQELHQDKREQMPELLDMLKDNFLQDEQGRFYIPDLSKSADLAKLRIKKLLKEFYESYVPGKAKLKAFRMEAIRAGFDDCWNKRDYKTIIGVGERLPEIVLQEDPALLMYYDNACVRG